jgi:hypothetical protein
MNSEAVCALLKSYSVEYGFDYEEAIQKLNIKEKSNVKNVNNSKYKSFKSLFPLPFVDKVEGLCQALNHNQGLYTQCQAEVSDACYCKVHSRQVEKNESGKPDYGSVEDRVSMDLFSYVDPKGGKQSAYTKIMKKYKVTREDVLAEAEKFHLEIDDKHFEGYERITEPKEKKVKDSKEKKVKEPKEAKEPKEPKEPKEKKTKGRPAKAKKVIELADDDEEDLFATLVANANSEEEESEPESETKVDKEAEKAKKEAEKAQKLAEKEAEKAKKEAEKAQKLAEKEAEKAQKLAEKEAEKAKKEAEKPKKETKKPAKKTIIEEEEEEEERVAKITYEGKKYLKSLKTGIIYDYDEYVNNNGEQVVVGKWNADTNKIDFAKGDDSEEEEEEYN